MLPIVNHPDYVAQIGDDHRFPIKKFGALFDLLKKDNILNKKICIFQSQFNIST
ncbi:hypothetical protein SAR11G3_01302 [Candidatus Pelagibacter sp. IMCC9063]|nr:hypothetical protein SAR11G3_01302 [Candidatus Pelagibacter sp. IMCC9063]